MNTTAKPAATRDNHKWGPEKVCVIDREALVPSSVIRAPGYAGIRAVIREQGRPRGMVRLALDGGELTPDRLAGAIEALPRPAVGPPLGLTAAVVLPRISVVVTTLGKRPALLQAGLRSLTKLDYPDYEVIVVDNRADGFPPLVLDGVRVVRETRPGLSAARNRGLAAASGEIVAFTDDDVEVDPAWLLAFALRFLAHPEEACVAGLLLPSDLRTPAQAAFEDYYSGLGPGSLEPISHRLRRRAGPAARLHGATVDAIGEDGRRLSSFSLYELGRLGTGANLAFRSEILRELGGFDRALGTGTPARGGEELALLGRLIWRGYSVGAEPAAIVYHSHPSEDASLAPQIRGYGVGYAAALTALVLEDPRHLGSMLATVPEGVLLLLRGFLRKRRLERPMADTPTRLFRIELRGMAGGPLAYLRARRMQRRWRP